MLSKIIGGPYRVFSSRELCKLGYTERKRPENYERKLSIKIMSLYAIGNQRIYLTLNCTVLSHICLECIILSSIFQTTKLLHKFLTTFTLFDTAYDKRTFKNKCFEAQI